MTQRRYASPRFAGAWTLAAALVAPHALAKGDKSAAKAASGPVTAADLVQGDAARGCRKAALAYDVSLQGLFGHPVEEGMTTRTYRVESRDSEAIVSWTNAPRAGDATTVMVNQGVWRRFDARTPEPTLLPPQDRLTGLAAVGDIVATCFAKDYQIVSSTKTTEGEATFLEAQLKARTPLVAFQSATVRLDPKTKLITWAKFRGDEGKIEHETSFAYEQTFKERGKNGKSGPFISKMTFLGKDAALTVESVRWTAPQAADYDATYFQVAKVVARHALPKPQGPDSTAH
jgi:hypothetical protein